MASTDEPGRRLRVGDLVRHAKLIDWGVGVVVALRDGKTEINFEHHGAALFDVSSAGMALAPVSPDEIEPESALLDAERWSSYALPPERRPRAGERRSEARCLHCREPLRRARLAAGGDLKACPECSQVNGTEHVYYASPAAFGTSVKRVTKANPTGVQSHCLACRQEGQPGAFRAWLCSAKKP